MTSKLVKIAILGVSVVATAYTTGCQAVKDLASLPKIFYDSMTSLPEGTPHDTLAPDNTTTISEGQIYDDTRRNLEQSAADKLGKGDYKGAQRDANGAFWMDLNSRIAGH